MEQKFIKYKPEQINLAKLYRFSNGCGDNLDANDIEYGTLIVGYCDKGKYLAMGYLRGITQDKETGMILYEIANAIEGQEYLTCIENPYKVDFTKLPYLAAGIESGKKPLIGKIFRCNGELATIYDGVSDTVVDVNNIYLFDPYFKENKQ